MVLSERYEVFSFLEDTVKGFTAWLEPSHCSMSISFLLTFITGVKLWRSIGAGTDDLFQLIHASLFIWSNPTRLQSVKRNAAVWGMKVSITLLLTSWMVLGATSSQQAELIALHLNWRVLLLQLLHCPWRCFSWTVFVLTTDAFQGPAFWQIFDVFDFWE